MPKVPFWVFILIAIVYCIAIRVDTMDVDASQYAEISREMLRSGSYLQIYDRNIDYLDKPPFLFWASATSMRLFGVGNLGFKLPSILFALLAIYATYRLTRLLYDDATARVAALVLATCQGMFLMTNDIRTDTILMSCVITAIWLIKEWQITHKHSCLLFGSAAIGIGLITKGPIALMVPVFAFASDWILKREWRNFFRPQYLLALVVIAIILIPMCIGLYQQFDMHPEKMVNGKQGVSGLRFFFWSQSFGRITGESPWKNDVYLLFLMENMLWSFMPWILLFIPALIINAVQLVRQKFRLQPHQEWLTMGGFILSYLALGSSSYQLPHYIFVAFPLASIITAKLLTDLVADKKYKAILSAVKPFFIGISILLLIASIILITYIFPSGVFPVILWIALAALWVYLAMKKEIAARFFMLMAAAMIIANVFVSGYVYPSLLNYQLGSHVGRYIHDRHIDTSSFACYKVDDQLNSIHFYAQAVVPMYDSVSDIRSRGFKYVLAQEKGMNELKQHGLKFDIEKQGEFFTVSQLTIPFIIPATRHKETKEYFLLKML
jgi:4-amino-4-deoxy-L-arabinose transferase-like glycosyltransferase